MSLPSSDLQGRLGHLLNELLGMSFAGRQCRCGSILQFIRFRMEQVKDVKIKITKSNEEKGYL